jgi:hypothetical protein
MGTSSESKGPTEQGSERYNAGVSRIRTRSAPTNDRRMSPLDIMQDQRMATHPAVHLQRLSRVEGPIQQPPELLPVAQVGGLGIYGSAYDIDYEEDI